MNKINNLVENFRKAIDYACINGEFKNNVLYKNFPKGCCGTTSNILAAYLHENGIKTFYINGTFYYENNFDNQSHAWLITTNDIIIDITADQFSDKSEFFNNNKKVYIGTNNEFYNLFEVERRDIHKGCICDELNNDELEIYQIVLKYIGEL